jgi:hypothetical protein
VKASTVIVETVMSELVTEGLELAQNVARSKAELAWHRVVMGRFLIKAKAQLPKRGTPTHGWTALLGALEMDEMTAVRYIALAEASLTLSERDKDKIPTYADLGLDKREGAKPSDDVPPPLDDDAPSSPARVSGEEAGDDTEADVEIDRDTWCTPKWITDAIGDFDLDPCANERSHVRAAREFRFDERGEDGLCMASKVDATDRVFINPPYSDVTPWIDAYAHTRFCFLLKFDPSTEWFALLMTHTKLVLFPRGTRVQFEAPEGVPADKAKANQFPHALFYARAEDATDAIRAVCFQPWRIK